MKNSLSNLYSFSAVVFSVLVALSSYQEVVLCDASTNVREGKSESEQFLKKHSPPKDLDARVDFFIAGKNYFSQLQKSNPVDYEKSENDPLFKKAGFFNKISAGGRNGFMSQSGTPVDYGAKDFFIKGSEVDRIINAERMKKYLKVNGLDSFKVASEFVRHEGGLPCVVSEEIEIGDQEKKISLKELQQIVKIMEDTGYCDWQFGANLVRDVDGKLVFVDLEDLSFGVFHSHIGRVDPKLYKLDSLARFLEDHIEGNSHECVANSSPLYKRVYSVMEKCRNV